MTTPNIEHRKATLHPKLIAEALATMMYPGTKRDPVESDMLADDARIDGMKVEFTLTFLHETDPLLRSILRVAEIAIHFHMGREAEANTKAEFKTAPRPEVDKLPPQVKNIIAVSSDKGGVGKSTVPSNLAIALAQPGYKVGLLDVDIFGPSVPKMFGVENERVYAIEKEDRQLIVPIEKHGVKLLSAGFLVNPQTATLWRDGMASNALKQSITDADWDELDYFILDTPPDTSDIYLTLLQTLAITGSVIMSTPQKVVLADARKGIDMYQNDKTNVPILELVGNMAWFTPAELPGNKYFIFGKNGHKQLTDEMKLPSLAQIPIAQSICKNGDGGEPSAVHINTMTGQAPLNPAQAMITVTNRRNREQQLIKIVKVNKQGYPNKQPLFSVSLAWITGATLL